MTSNVEEMNNNHLIDKEYDEEHEKFMKRMKRLDELLTKYEKLKEEEKAEDMKLEIWNAHVRNEIIGLQLKDGDIFIGRSRFSMDTNYTSVDQLKEMIDINFKLANGVPIEYHIGGKSVNLFISNIKQIFVMTRSEVADANQYPNMAPEFIKRLLPGDNSGI
jgi:hypothetical protein